MIDLMVVGAGPAGLGAAIAAARLGMTVRVIDPRDGPIDKACGEGLMPAAVAALDRLGVVVGGHRLAGIRYLDGRHQATAPFRHGPGLGVRRTDLQQAMEQRARDCGAELMSGRVGQVEQLADSVRAAGVRARYLVAADGLHSPVRRSLGLTAPPGRARPRWGLRRHYSLAPWTDLVEVHWARRSEAYVTPVGADEVGIAVLTDRRGPFAEQLVPFPGLADRLGGAQPASEVRGAGPLRVRTRARVAGRVLLVGDAAGYVDAITGEGVRLALATALEAVRCIAADDPAGYDAAWRRVSRSYRVLTGGLLWARRQPMLAGRIVPAAAALPGIFAAGVDRLAG